jgi:hypothetical protein
MQDILNPCDYFGPFMGFTADLPAVFFLKPNSGNRDVLPTARGIQHVVSPPHTFTENEDGSLTISPSISDKQRGSTKSDGWHGFLENGIWREVSE